jgi:hypothetical protein
MRKQETQSEEMKNKSFILLGWEPSDLRLQQLSDPDIGILLVELELTNTRPKWESVSSGTLALKTLCSQ